MPSIIEVEHLTKRYGAVTAVDDISFRVEPGALFAFLGPNGAGKSTTISILCTILRMDQGRVSINGYQVGSRDDDIRRSIGVVFQNSVLDPLLTVRENIAVRASFYGLKGAELKKRIGHVIDVVGLGECIDRPYGKLSGGQRRRADIARSLIHTPRVLFLDEPTTGLDPQTRLRVWSTIADMRRTENTTVFLTTHYMEEAAGADDVAIIDHGHIVAQGSPAQLKERHSSDTLILVSGDDAALRAALDRMGRAYTPSADTLVLPVHNSMDALQVLKAVEGHVASFEVRKGDMDAVFMNVTGRGIRAQEEAQ